MLYRRDRSQFWWVSYTRNGKRYRKSTGETDRTRAEAIAKTLCGTTVDAVLEEYISRLAKPERAQHASKALLAAFSGKTALSPLDIQKYRDGRQAAPATIRKELSILGSAYNWCRKELGWDVVNPVAGKLGPKPRGRLRWITRPEGVKLIESAREGPEYLWRFVQLGLHTGMRKEEMLGLEWCRVDIPAGLVYLDQQKNGEYGSVPLNRMAVEALSGERIGRWVFQRKRERLLKVNRSFEAACQRAGIDNFHIHDMRHTCAAWMVQAGVPLRSVAEVLRHRDIRTTMIYAHLSPESTRQAVAALEV